MLGRTKYILWKRGRTIMKGPKQRGERVRKKRDRVLGKRVTIGIHREEWRETDL